MGNCAVNMTAAELNATIEWFERFTLISSIVIPTVYSIVFVAGLVGNATLIYTILANKWMRTKSNVLIVSLAAGDFLLILVSVPFAILIYTTDGWIFGQVMCKLFVFLETLSVAVSILTLTALSGDRFIAIVFPLYVYKSGSMRRTIYVTAALWVVSTMIALPDMFGAHVNESGKVPYCDPYHPDWNEGYWYDKFRTMFRFVVLFACPLVVITAFYSAIAFTLLRRSTQDAFSAITATGDTGVRQLNSRRKVANIVLMFVVIFVMCWAPRHIYLISWYYFDICYNAYWHVFKAAGLCLIFIYSAINPFALYVINDQFRRFFDHYLCGRCVKSRRMALNADRRRSTLTSTTGNLQLTTSPQQNTMSLDELLSRAARSGSLALSTPDINKHTSTAFSQ